MDKVTPECTVDDVRKHIVRISFKWQPEVEDKKFMIITGVIASIDFDGYAIIIANPVFFKTQAECSVRFPKQNGYERKSTVSCSSVKYESDHFCIFKLKPKETGFIKPVNFAFGDPRKCRKVYAFFFPRKGYLTPEGFVEGKIIDSTTVKNPKVGIFFHDCPLHEYGYLGSPVFNKNGNLVGISYLDQGHVQAWSVSKLRDNLLWKINGFVSSVED